MDTFASMPAAEREVYFRQAGANLGLPPQIIEKDFWVCWMLKRLFALPCVSGYLLFKGGTSLSKAYGLIRRFSEDIDLSIHRVSLGFGGDADPAPLKGKLFKRANEALGEAARQRIQEVIQPALAGALGALLENGGWRLEQDSSDPEGQSLAFVYPVTRVTPGVNAYLRPAIKVEFGARADHEPAEFKVLRPYLAEAIPGALAMPDATVKVISARRTFWEKATILHQMAHLSPDKPFPPRYSRHYCDLASMIDAGLGSAVSRDDNLLARVVAHKQVFYAAKWASYETAIRGTLCLVPPKERHGQIARDLDSMSEMFFDGPPPLGEVIATLRTWQDSFNLQTEAPA